MLKKFYGYMERIATGIERLFALGVEILKVLNTLIENKPDQPTPPAPTPPVDDAWYAWWTRPMEEWPTHVDGLRVGYVRVNVDKSPLYVLGENRVPRILEDDTLREGSGTDAKRIIAKDGRWLMVYALGDTYAGVMSQEVRPFGENIDGDGLYYRVMNEQPIDGIALWDYDYTLYVRYEHINNVHIN